MTVHHFFRHEVAEKVREEGREEGRVEGRAPAKAEMVLQILDWRGLAVPDALRAHVLACTDTDRLESWAQRAVHAHAADDLLTGDAG
ncbi:hypothetical protein ACWDFR_07810 [Streptomyces sp. 900105755]